MSARPIRALLVEDNPADAQLLQALLGQVHVEVRPVRRLSEAVEVLAGGGVDVVLLDVSLAEARGADPVAWVHAAAPGVALVVLTAQEEDAAARRALRAGAQDALVKGQLDAPQLAGALRAAMERKQAEATALRLAREQLARAEAEAAAARFQLLAEVSRELAFSLDYRATLPTVAHLLVPLLGDACAVDVLEEGTLRRLAEACTTATPLPGTDAPDGPVQEALHTQAPVLRSTPAGPLLAVPLVARGQTLGVLSLRHVAGAPPYGTEEATLVLELAAQVALAVDNARLYHAREEVISIVSHDLRNPLAVIGFAVDHLRRPELPAAAMARQLEKIRRAADQMNRLITDLLDVTRMDAGTLSVEPVHLEAAVLVREAHEQLRPLAEAKGLLLELQLAPALPTTLADRERVMQVFSNLVGNAIKFTPAGGRVRLGAAQVGAEVCFTVADTGPGIRREDLSRIFDRFWQGGREHRQGAGLGLAISRGLVQAHGGRIWAESQEGLGTTFFFTLPTSEAAAARPPARSVPQRRG